MPYFEPGSRSCLRCGVLVPDPGRDLHIAFHERIDPQPTEPVEAPESEEPQ